MAGNGAGVPAKVHKLVYYENGMHDETIYFGYFYEQRDGRTGQKISQIIIAPPYNTVRQSISHYPLLVSGAARFSRFLLPAGQPVYRCVPPHRSPGSGQEVTDFQSSNGRHHNNKSSIHRHLAFVV